ITDPPRDGMHHKVVEAIISSGIKKIVYVSCNPSTFARDVDLLNQGGYTLVKVQPVDMFPQTFHVETVGLLVKREQE
ncbi:MAG: 23S rRNA (uracil-5-)-methyltransferase RumA, partial [Candidatus Delongbacteria bacterium]|nr:23S rRNA (uracil-5-)-methyltransferase RumA [Candidatus Delongbacteria bacterium]